MKKSIFVLFALILSISAFSQKGTSAVVLYFKADLACCHARACGTLENDVKAVVEQNFKDGNVVFRSVRIADSENADLVSQYNAKSQTVIIVVNKKKKLSSVDATALVAEFRMNRNKEKFETEFVKLIQDSMK